jgi:hypothetical protein
MVSLSLYVVSYTIQMQLVLQEWELPGKSTGSSQTSSAGPKERAGFMDAPLTLPPNMTLNPSPIARRRYMLFYFYCGVMLLI